jgi:glutamate 5-kinase
MRNRIVIKLGSLAVTNEDGGVSKKKISKIIADLATLIDQNFEFIIVSSGAINSGKIHLRNFNSKEISSSQAASAVGQPLLMKAYQEIFETLELKCAQILVTHEDFKNKKRFINIRNTINTLLENKIIPIVNENDTVSYDEITVGDNDQLAALMTEASDSNSLILLTEADGLYNKNPKDLDAIKYTMVEYNEKFQSIQFAQKTNVGRGGMDTKLKAVRKLTPLGIHVYLGSFQNESPLSRLLLQKQGTFFKGKPNIHKSKHKSWLLTLVKNECFVVVDEGAKNALSKNNPSLLPIGVKKVFGKFNRGDVIGIKYKNSLLAVGMSEFSAKEVDLIKGLQSNAIDSIISNAPSKVIIHRDNLVLTMD